VIDSPDSHELDSLEQLAIHDGWLQVEARVREVIERKRDALERSGDKADEHRGFLTACRMFLNLPATIAAEIQSQIGANE
jgi:hypothetical protein